MTIVKSFIYLCHTIACAAIDLAIKQTDKYKENMKLHRHTTGPWKGRVNVRRTLLSMEPGERWAAKFAGSGESMVREAASRLATATGRKYTVRKQTTGSGSILWVDRKR